MANGSTIHSDPLRLLSVAEVAVMYGVTTRAVNLWAQNKRIPKPCVDHRNYRRWRYCDIAENIMNLGAEEKAEASR